MLTDKMRDAFGYDQFGNSHRLVALLDRREMRSVPRASGRVICPHCGVLYQLHPQVQGALWATRTCNAGIVKL